MSRNAVRISSAALQDVRELRDYIAAHDSPDAADHVLSLILDAIDQLSEFPHRGARPVELLDFGVDDYRQTHAGPYRIVHEITDGSVDILLIADGRRDMATLLARRLFSA